MKQKHPVSIDHLNFTVKNFRESVSWYRDIFGFALVEEGVDGMEGGPWGILRSGDFMLCIHENPNKQLPREDESQHQIYHFGLRVSDRADWEKAVKEFNLRTYYGSPVRYPHSLSWYIKDPTGYMIEVALWNNDTVTFS